MVLEIFYKKDGRESLGNVLQLILLITDNNYSYINMRNLII